jgi:hypothetical protein
MEPEGSLPTAQAPAICSYPEAKQSSPRLPPTSWRCVLILSSHLRLVLTSSLFPSGLPTKILFVPLLSPHVPHAQPILFFLIWSPD